MKAAAIAVLLLAGCAGSPAHTSSLPPDELAKIDDYTLCKAATPRELYEPSGNVIKEVQARGLDCRRLYTYVPLPDLTSGGSSGRTTRTNCTAFGNSMNCVSR